jgi:hypothetical protein
MNAITSGRALLAGITMLIAGCSLTPNHTITAEEAVHKMDAYLRETITSVPSSLNFSHREVDVSYTGGCTKYPVGDEFTGQVIPDMAYTAKTSKTDDIEVTNFLNAVAAYWKSKSATLESRPDGFAIRPFRNDYDLVVSYYSEAHLVELAGVLRACIWRYGTPQPDDNP